MPEITPKLLPFLEAIRFFRGKGLVLSPDSFRDVWAAQHVQAFTVARVTSMDVLEDIRGAVRRAVEKGVSLGDFKRGLAPLLESKGWYVPRGEKAWVELPDGTLRKRLHPWRLETIYRTNLQSAYQAGRYAQMIEAAKDRPYWQYDAVLDSRTRPTHAMLDGKVYDFRHPFWDTWYPPNGHNCRCSVRTLSARQMRERGLVEQTVGMDLRPDAGFDYNPGIEKWKPDLTKYSPPGQAILNAQNVGVPQDMPALAEHLTRLRDGYRATGMPISTEPLRIQVSTIPGLNGWARYSTGEIGLRTDLYDLVRTSLKNGRAWTPEEVDAVKTLVHEFGHHLGYGLNAQSYAQDMAYNIEAQTVNDLWARHSVSNTLKALGLKYNQAEVARLKSYHPSGYQTWIVRLRALLKAAGLEEWEEKALVTELNLTERPENYSDRLWAVLKERRPNLTAYGRFGNILYEESKFDWLMSELQQ